MCTEHARNEGLNGSVPSDYIRGSFPSSLPSNHSMNRELWILFQSFLNLQLRQSIDKGVFLGTADTGEVAITVQGRTIRLGRRPRFTQFKGLVAIGVSRGPCTVKTATLKTIIQNSDF